MSQPPDATDLLTDIAGGSREAADRLLGLVYDELRDLAQGYLRRERPDHTLMPTALVHEAYLRMVDQSRVDWQGRSHFKAIAGRAMQRALVDHARGRNREKRGGKWRRVGLDDAFHLAPSDHLEPVALDDALSRMRELDERQTQVVELRVFGGLSSEEIARVLDVSKRTVERDWKMGQAWLRRELGQGDAT